MKHVMIDLETMGNKPGCAIIAIGAVSFGKNKANNWEVSGPEISHFYKQINLQSCLDAGLKFDASTVLWWLKQSQEARAAFDANEKASPLGTVLMEFVNWWRSIGGVYPWGCGSDFDISIITAAVEAARTGCKSISVTDFSPPWLFWNSRCYRTLKNLSPIKADKGPEVAHNALDDALSQAHHAVAILNAGGFDL